MGIMARGTIKGRVTFSFSRLGRSGSTSPGLKCVAANASVDY
jgi:hypothetical protein